MSDDGEKHFEPTPSRIAKAKREGNTIRAAEFGANVAFALAAASCVAIAPLIGAAIRDAIVRAARGEGGGTGAFVALAWAIVPMTAAALGGCVASLVQSGGLNLTPVVAKFERLAPGPSLQRMFSGEAVMHALRAGVAVAVAGAFAIPALHDLFAAALRHASATGVAGMAWNGAQRVVAAIAVLGAFFALAEFGVARRAWLRKLRMSFDEYKRERKEQDGDPAARAHRKALHRSIARSAISKVKDAAFVLVNPTHVAIALEYRPPVVPVPTVLLRSADEVALRVRELAQERHIPIVENVPLARALYRDAQVGAPIPIDHYVAVAEVVGALVRSGALT
ncbi:MAG TPA: EscU/YscU/HrcU family type III secretion system export apparatus switch protein [Candidatus Baltobacteraceae bacterium]|nr:EscU/YscU/HrcU family type III secretion system export apparatus switch protein [Candidatus Baltobacteraceae bacterium]